MLVVPASKDVFKKAIKEGCVDIFLDEGATFVTPGCACWISNIIKFYS